MSSPGRNDPCPCGSGKKYKHCCYLNQSGDSAGNGIEFSSTPETRAVFAEIEQAMKDRNFSSLEEVQAFADSFMNNRNRSPAPGFHGLSPEQMHVFLDFPFDSPHLASFAAHPAGCENAPVMRLFLLLAEAAGEKGLKTTAKGNLPQQFCRNAAQRYWSEEEYARWTRYGRINREDDFLDLHIMRVTAVLAGLIRKYRGRFVLTKRCRKYLGTRDSGGLYRELLQAHTREYNWGYMDGYGDLRIVQQSFLFTLHLLHCYGDNPRPNTFYEDCFLEAFPAVLDEVEEGFLGAETQVRNCYTVRTLRRFANYFGLASVTPVDGDPLLSREGYTVQALPLLGEVVRFHGISQEL